MALYIIRIMVALALSCLTTLAYAQQINGPNAIMSQPLLGAFKVGRFYGPIATSAPVNETPASANRLWAMPFLVGSSPSVVKTMSFDIGTGNASAWNARMCIFSDTGSGLPGSLVVDTGTIAISSGSVTGIQTATLSGGGVTLGSGWYWVGIMVDSTGEQLFGTNNSNTYYISSALVGFDSLANGYGNSTTGGYYMTQTLSNGCPLSFTITGTTASNAVPYVYLGF